MIEAFLNHIRQKSLLDSNSTYLLACSGGMDSMVLANLLVSAEIRFEIAHVNFHLRGNESEGDESFVKEWAKSHGITFHVLHAQAEEVAKNNKISIQMAAREIRYDWFEKLRLERNLKGILLAHHEDDQIETIFLNLLRVTGIDGINGMSAKKGWLIRPLLPFSRRQLEIFAGEAQLQWREDSSNKKTEYKRNKLRLDVLPVLFDSAENARENLLNSFEKISETGKAFNGLLESWKKTHLRTEDEFQFLSSREIIGMAGAPSILFFWLRPYGFNADQAKEILKAIHSSESGKMFESPSHLLNVDREELILMPRKENFEPILIEKDDIVLQIPEGDYDLLKLEQITKIDSHKENAMLDLDKIDFPLELRTWQLGDRFVPLGMKHSKKISDFLIDLKVPLAKKQSLKVLVSKGEIVWVLGYRIADWAKYSEATRKILYFKKRN
ncbi:tRNA lysidine(34) synthetase TilS [Algoriphagus sp. CAU 1675]|uniref:tRNA lysidine(34) synthetase TilS n=1 Tax=Algoriphagus sp. CAU 1675 TaxID=3032597 RepID=UPI0023DC573C|nr:tRNA lysidine(34) synthetase TilS [Algoriphagus sp. CAU 1675]MDF2158675.1 tRNA lysidine(34) synthetase TilS [Algoriphagus sp. CAU 1675]